MIKVDVFFGSYKELQNTYSLPISYITISDITQEEKTTNDDEIHSFKEDKFVCLTEDYSQLTDTGLRNLHSIIIKTSVTYIILQNPPKIVLDNFRKLESQIYLELSIKYAGSKEMSEKELLEINRRLDNQIIGQHKAKQEILASLYTLHKINNKKPVVLMLYGPSGVGKTETAKIINNVKEDYLQRLNMSMFQNQYYINYLFGENHNSKSFAVELLEKRPSVILLDEFDKAPPIIHNAFYKAFDESQFDDSHYQVSLDNTLVICTSNYRDKDQIQKHIGSPLYNRLNDIIQYNQLSQKEVDKVIDKIFDIKYCELDEQEKVCIKRLNLKSTVKNYVCDQGYNDFRSIENSIEKLFNHVLVKELIFNSETE